MAAARGGDPVRTLCDGCTAPLGARDERCIGCRSTSYCDASCQRAHWRAGHKLVCKAVGAAVFARSIAAAEAGNALAMRNVAVYYERGTGTVKDLRAAFEWTRRAAEAGNAKAQYFLGAYYVTGQGVSADVREATAWLERAAASGDAKWAEKARETLAELRACGPP